MIRYFTLAVFLSLFIPLQQSSAQTGLSRKPEQTMGVFYGKLDHVNPEFIGIVVVPFQDYVDRQRFFVDSKTKYFVDKRRKRKQVILDEIGENVAVKFFGEDSILIADEVYIEHKDLDPEDYKKKKRK